MIWYLLNILIIICVWLWPVNNVVTEKNIMKKKYIPSFIRRKRVCIIATINWIILSGLRDWSVGADTLAYKIYHFDKTINKSWGEIFYNFYLKYRIGIPIKDPGYPLFEKIFQIFSKNYQIFLIFIACIFFILLGIKIYKYSENPCLSYIVFSTLFYSFFAVTGHRQTLATAMVVFGGIELIKKRKLISFLVLLIIASTIHTSVICFLPFYWLSQIKIKRIVLTIYWILILNSLIFKTQFLMLLHKVVGYDNYGFDEAASGGTFMLLLFSLSIFITIFYKIILKNYFLENLNEKSMLEISINALLIASIFAPLLFINPAFMRVIQYYSIFIMFLLPKCKYAFSKKNWLFFEIICCGIMIVLFIKKQPEYMFFWEQIKI